MFYQSIHFTEGFRAGQSCSPFDKLKRKTAGPLISCAFKYRYGEDQSSVRQPFVADNTFSLHDTLIEAPLWTTCCSKEYVISQSATECNEFER